jgi:hypothetical protein
MDEALHTLLLSGDVVGSWEHPPNANWERSVAEVEHLKPQLEQALGVELRLDKGVQDASFFADLGLLVEQREPSGVIYLSYEICFRFSWFSKLYTIHGNTWESRMNNEAAGFLKRAGFTYVPAEALAEPYDGFNTPYEPGLTWWVRYFDYL